MFDNESNTIKTSRQTDASLRSLSKKQRLPSDSIRLSRRTPRCLQRRHLPASPCPSVQPIAPHGSRSPTMPRPRRAHTYLIRPPPRCLLCSDGASNLWLVCQSGGKAGGWSPHCLSLEAYRWSREIAAWSEEVEQGQSKRHNSKVSSIVGCQKGYWIRPINHIGTIRPKYNRICINV
jgi:hypothetical protein